MLQKSWPNIVTVSCIVVVAIVEAMEQAVFQSPHLASALPGINSAWHYLPLFLLITAGAVWLFGRLRSKPSLPTPDAFIHPRWQIVSGHRFENEAIDVDGKSFRSCTFTNVTFLFHGTAPTEFTGKSLFDGSFRLDTDHPPTMFWRTLEGVFSKIAGAAIESSPIDGKGQKVELKIDALAVNDGAPKSEATERFPEPAKGPTLETLLRGLLLLAVGLIFGFALGRGMKEKAQPPQIYGVGVDCYDSKGNLLPDPFAKFHGVQLSCAPGETAKVHQSK